jgi:guanine deaminase
MHEKGRKGVYWKSANGPELDRPPSSDSKVCPSVHPELMTALSDVSKSVPTILCQSHISENLTEMDWVKSLRPECDSDTGNYNHFGHLSRRTLLAPNVSASKRMVMFLIRFGWRLVNVGVG